MHGLYVFGLVGMRLKWPADEDCDRQYAGRVRGNAVNTGCVDAGLHAAADSMHIYLFRLVCVPA